MVRGVTIVWLLVWVGFGYTHLSVSAVSVVATLEIAFCGEGYPSAT